MDLTLPEFALGVIGVAAGGVGAYVAVRVDLARLTERAAHTDKRLDEIADDADNAHKRIDRIMRYRGGEDTTQ